MKKTLSLLTVMFLHTSFPDFNTYCNGYSGSVITAYFTKMAVQVPPIIAFEIQPQTHAVTNSIPLIKKEKHNWDVNYSLHQGMLAVENESIE